MTLYEILGVKPKAQPTEVKRAYRKLARASHPDISTDPEAHDRMAQLNQAFEVLSDPVRRMEYDASLGYAKFSEPVYAERTERQGGIKLRILRRHTKHSSPIYGLDFDAGNRLVSGGFDNSIFAWDKHALTLEKRITLDGSGLTSLVAVRPGYFVVAGCHESHYSVWTYKDGQIDSWRRSTDKWVCCVSPSPDGRLLAVGYTDGSHSIHDCSRGARIDEWSAHKDCITSLAWSPRSDMLATGAADSTIRLWMARGGREQMCISRVRGTPKAVAFSPDGKKLAAGGIDLSLRLYNLDEGEVIHTYFGHDKPIEQIGFHPSSKVMASVGRDGVIQLYDIFKGTGHGKLETSFRPLKSIAFSPDGKHMAAGGLDKVLRVWRVQPAS